MLCCVTLDEALTSLVLRVEMEKRAHCLVSGNQNGRCEQREPRQTTVCGSRQESRIPVSKDTQPTGTMFHIRINKRTVQNPFPVSPGQVWGPRAVTPRVLVSKRRRLHSWRTARGAWAGPGS